MDSDDTLLAVLRAVRSDSYIEWPTLTASKMRAAIKAGLIVATPLAGVSVDLRRHQSVPYSVQSFAASRANAKAALRDVALALDGERGKSLNFVDVSQVPAPVPSGRDGVWSFEAAWTVAVRARA